MFKFWTKITSRNKLSLPSKCIFPHSNVVLQSKIKLCSNRNFHHCNSFFDAKLILNQVTGASLCVVDVDAKQIVRKLGCQENDKKRRSVNKKYHRRLKIHRLRDIYVFSLFSLGADCSLSRIKWVVTGVVLLVGETSSAKFCMFLLLKEYLRFRWSTFIKDSPISCSMHATHIVARKTTKKENKAIKESFIRRSSIYDYRFFLFGPTDTEEMTQTAVNS